VPRSKHKIFNRPKRVGAPHTLADAFLEELFEDEDAAPATPAAPKPPAPKPPAPKPTAPKPPAPKPPAPVGTPMPMPA